MWLLKNRTDAASGKQRARCSGTSLDAVTLNFPLSPLEPQGHVSLSIPSKWTKRRSHAGRTIIYHMFQPHVFYESRKNCHIRRFYVTKNVSVMIVYRAFNFSAVCALKGSKRNEKWPQTMRTLDDHAGLKRTQTLKKWPIDQRKPSSEYQHIRIALRKRVKNKNRVYGRFVPGSTIHQPIPLCLWRRFWKSTSSTCCNNRRIRSTYYRNFNLFSNIKSEMKRTRFESVDSVNVKAVDIFIKMTEHEF